MPVNKKSKQLNARQKRFVTFLSTGLTQKDAYIKAGYSPVEAQSNAATLINLNQSAKAELQRLQSLQSTIALDAVTETIMAPLERKQRLTVFAREDLINSKGEVNRASNIASVQELNKMGGDYAPSKHLVGGRVIFEVIHVERKQRGNDDR